MNTWVIALLGVLTLVGSVAWWWFIDCERSCAAIDHDAQELFQRGELLSVLTRIDAIDARCRCTRFTSGDTPSQYAIAQTCLRQLMSNGRTTEVERLLAHTRSPILKELAKQSGVNLPQ